MPALDRLRNTKRRLTVIAASIVLMALSACAIAPPPNAVVMHPTPQPSVRTARETRGPAVWVKGHYSYVDGQYVWVPGYWGY